MFLYIKTLEIAYKEKKIQDQVDLLLWTYDRYVGWQMQGVCGGANSSPHGQEAEEEEKGAKVIQFPQGHAFHDIRASR